MRLYRSVSTLVASASIVVASTFTARAEEYPELKVEKLLVSRTAYNGQPLAYPEGKQAEVSALTVTIPQGGSTGWHLHQVPVYAYVMEGELTIDLKPSGSYRFRKGDVILEVREILHNGRNSGQGEVKLLVFYAGASGVPNVTKPVETHTAKGNKP